jgi:hypothetical protein
MDRNKPEESVQKIDNPRDTEWIEKLKEEQQLDPKKPEDESPQAR